MYCYVGVGRQTIHVNFSFLRNVVVEGGDYPNQEFSWGIRKNFLRIQILLYTGLDWFLSSKLAILCYQSFQKDFKESQPVCCHQRNRVSGVMASFSLGVLVFSCLSEKCALPWSPGKSMNGLWVYPDFNCIYYPLYVGMSVWTFI